MDLQKLFDELKDEIADLGICDCVTKSVILHPESNNSSVFIRLENQRYVADFQIWEASMTYTIGLLDMADEKMRIDIDKYFSDTQEPENGAYWLISFFAGMPKRTVEKGGQPDALGTGSL